MDLSTVTYIITANGIVLYTMIMYAIDNHRVTSAVLLVGAEALAVCIISPKPLKNAIRYNKNATLRLFRHGRFIGI